MPSNFSRNSVKVNDIYNKFKDEAWLVDRTYQRRKVWGEKDNVRLIETILLELVIPEIFIWDCETDPNTGKTITHIVDGQQRINAIFEYISDKFKLKSKFLLDEKIKSLYGDKTFSQLPDDIKKKIWIYEISVVDLNSAFTIDEIKNIFYRLNLTDYSLTDQEKRNSLDSAFGKAAENLADSEFWTENKIFSPKDIRRMSDVEYCSTIFVLCREGIIDQTKQDVLNSIYEDYADEYADAEKDRQKINSAIGLIKLLINDETKTFVSKKVQMYTLFSIAFDFLDNNISLTGDIKNLFIQFVKTYNAFKNGYDFPLETEKEKNAFEMIKKYKLASSEGVNKLTNRMIRHEVLKKVILGIDKIDVESLYNIEHKCISQENE